MIHPPLLIFPWTITLRLLLCVVITFLHTPCNTNIIFVINPFHLYSGKCYEHKTLLGATYYDVKSNSAWNFPLITTGSFLSIEALVLLSVHFIFPLHWNSNVLYYKKIFKHLETKGSFHKNLFFFFLKAFRWSFTFKFLFLILPWKAKWL